MKKVLVITYYWPPSGGAGVQRWLKFVKYLRGYGWEPVVYTPENPEFPETDDSLERDIPGKITVLKRPVWEPYSLYKKLLGQKKEERINAAFLSEKKKNSFLENISVWIRGNFFIPDARKFWIRPSVKFLSVWLKDNPVNAIVSTGPPHSMHLIALAISKKRALPWLADFRDPWTNIDFYKDLKLTCPADRKHHRLEKKVLTDAAAVTVISRGMAEEFNQIHPRKYDIVTNGFDPDDVAEGDAGPGPLFSLAHIGSLTATRNPGMLWKVLSEIAREDGSFARSLKIILAGKTDFSVREAIREAGLESNTQYISYLPHSEVTRLQQRSQVLLLLINQTPNAKGILTGKFYEYLAAGRPVLCIGPEDGDAAMILKETGSGRAIGFDDDHGLRGCIMDFYRSYQSGKLAVEGTGIDRYSRKSLTGEIAKILDRISG